jgi:hypothetical protein
MSEGPMLLFPSVNIQDGKVKIPYGPGWGVKINQTWMQEETYLKNEV